MTPTFFSIVFSAEAAFELNGSVNRHNCRFWFDNNLHWMLEAHTQNSQKLNDWADMLNNTLIDPFFIDGNLNAAKYKDMLRNELPAIRRIVGDNFAHTWFQQDGAGIIVEMCEISYKESTTTIRRRFNSP